MVAWGFHFSEGGTKTGSGPFIQRLNAAGIPVMMKGTASAGLCYEAQQSGIAHGVDNVIVYRMTNNSEYHYDTPRYDLSPSAAAWAHFEKTAVKWPSELDRALVWMEPINEPRAKLEPNETTPTWGNMHPVAWLGRFMVEYAQIAQASGFKVCGPSFASGDPEVDLWQLEGMADWLRYCADNPETASVSVHEYNYGATAYYADNYPWHYGRFQAIIAAADVLGIPRTFPILITEFGWKYDWVPWWEQAQPTLAAHTSLCAAFPQVKGVAVWTLQGGWGGISDRLVQWIAPDGNPFANWVISNQIPAATQPQPTAPEFGATLPQQPPDGGEGENMIVSIGNNHGGYITHLGDGDKVLVLTPGKFNGRTFVPSGTNVEIPLGADVRALQYVSEGVRVVEVECPEEPTDPNPPPVVSNPLPQGALIVDVSYANDVNLSTLKANGVQGVIIRASNGIRLTGSSNAVGVDVRFWQHLEEAAQLGMPWGAYHYCNEKYDDVAQVQHFLSIIETAVNEGYPLPSLGLWLDFETPSDPAYAGAPTAEARIQAICTVLASLRPSAVADYGVYTSKGWWDAKVPNAASWVPALGIKAWVAAWVASGTLVNGWPPSWWHPSNLKGFTAVHFWQWTSAGGFEVGHSVDSLDLNFVGNTAVPPTTEPPDPPTPPVGQTYDTSFMRGEPGIWRVIRRGDGSGEDVWEFPLDSQNDVRVKNTHEGEWYFYGMGGVWRKRDTSPAPDPATGAARLYMFNEGGQIAPNEAQIGVTYSYPNYVQFKAKNNCQNLSTNSGPSTSTFLLKEVIQNYTFPGTGVTVDWLYVTVQTGETQLYSVHNGRTLGWVGGGAQQANNVWAGELAEVHYDRQIPQQEPPRYCS